MSNGTLFINRTDSVCGACNGHADPYEESHTTRLGWAETRWLTLAGEWAKRHRIAMGLIR